MSPRTDTTTTPPSYASGWRLHLGWGIGTLGASLLLNCFAVVVPFYLTTVLGIGAASVAGILFVAKLWDIVSNPLMGAISDRTETRWGRRRPYLVLGGIVAGAALAGLFALAASPLKGSIPIVVVVLMLIGTGYTIFNVPYMAMPAEMVSDYQDRTRMFSYRVLFIGIGTFVGGASGQRIAELFGGGTAGYASMGLAIGAGACFFMLLAFFGTAGAHFTTRSRESVPLRAQVALIAANRPFAMLLAVKFTQLFGLFTNTAVALFAVKFVIGRENPGAWMVWFGVFSTLAQLATIPLWLAFARRFEKRVTYIVATLLFVVAALTWLVASPAEPLWFFCLRATLKGVAAAGLLLMGQSMLSDTTEYDFKRTGLRREGIYSALYSFVEKVASAVAPSLLLLFYAWFGFDSKAPEQSAHAIDGIRYAAGLLPSLYFAASLPFLLLYKLTERVLKSTEPAAT